MSTLEPPKPGEIRRGMSWATIGQVGGEGLRVVTFLVLAQFMTPEEFGLFSMVTVFSNFAPVLLNLGFGSSLVQRRHTSQADLSTVFWVNVGVGATLAALFARTSPLLAAFYGRPEIAPLAAVLALNFIVLAPSNVHRTMLMRDLRFRGLAVIDLVATLSSSIVAVTIALSGASTWSLVAWTLLRSGVQSLGSLLLYRWRPSLTFSVVSVREMGGFAANVAASETLNYVASNIDCLLVGKFLGATAVGIYEAAVRLMLVPVMNTSVVLGRVLYPAFARLQDDRQRLKELYLRSARISLFVSTPVLVGLALCARPFVGVAYPPAWSALVPVLQLTAPAGVAATLLALSTSVFRSTGRADLELRIGFLRRVLGVVGPAIGLWWNVVAVATGRLVASILGVPMYQLVVGRVLGLTVREQLENLVSLAACASAMTLVVMATDWLLFGAPDGVALAADVAAGAVTYIAVAMVIRDRLFLELRAMTAHAIAQRGTA